MAPLLGVPVVPVLIVFLLMFQAAYGAEPVSPPPQPAPASPADSIINLMHQAASQRKQGDYAGAAESYRKVLKRAPGLYEARLFLADTLRKDHRGSEAESEFRAACRIKPTEPYPYLGLADLRREAFRYDEAGAFLDEGLAAVPKEKTEPLLIARGLLLREAGDSPGSLAKLQEAGERFPASGRVKEGLGLTMMTLGRVDEAVAAFEAARVQAPEAASIELELREARSLAESLARAEAETRNPTAGAAAWAAAARLRFLARQYPQSVKASDEALRREKGRGDLLLLKARALEELGQLPQARVELAKISRKSPEHLTSLYHLAWLARKGGDAAGEERIWGEALKYYPADPGAALMRVLCWKRGGTLEKQSDLLKKANGGKGDPSYARLPEAIAAEELGRAEDAAQAYAAMLRAEPGNPEVAARLSAVLARSPEQLKAWLESTQPAADGAKEDPALIPLRALLLETAGRHAEALRLLRESAASHPDRGEVALSLALRLEGNDREMKEWLDKAVALTPSSPWPHLHKGLFLLKSGDGAGARREAEAAKAIAPRLPEAFQLAGSAARVEADYPAAAQQLSQALLLDPSDSLGVARVQLALAYAGAKDGPASRQALEGDLPPFPDLIYRLAWAFVDRNFLDRTARGPAWQPMRDAFTDPNARPAQAYAAVAASLASLGDPYTRLRSAQETEALYVRGRLERMVTDASGAPSPASSAVVTGDLGDDIGYLRLTTFSDPSAREAIRKALEQMAQKQGLVLDLRGNLGGLVAEADAVAGMLLEEGQTLGIQRTGTGEEVQKIPQTRPAFPRKRPLVILTDRRTGSAAEKLAAGLQGSGRATILGETTLGKGAGQMSRLLPGGAMLLVTAVESLAPSGEAIQGRGVVPDVPAESDESLEKAREILEKPPPPPTP